MPRWNPSTGRWDIFRDGALQLATVREICKLRGAYPPDKPDEPQEIVEVFIDKRIFMPMPRNYKPVGRPNAHRKTS